MCGSRVALCLARYSEDTNIVPSTLSLNVRQLVLFDSVLCQRSAKSTFTTTISDSALGSSASLICSDFMSVLTLPSWFI